MIIAAHFFGTSNNPSNLQHWFHIFAAKYPQEQFILFIDPSMTSSIPTPSNCKIIPVSPSLKNGLLLHYWYNFKLPSLLNKYNVAAFITETGACSLRTTVPQCMLLQHEVWGPATASSGPNSRYIKKFFPKFWRKVAAVVVPETYMTTSLFDKYEAAGKRMVVAPPGLPEIFRPAAAEQKLAQQETTSGGYEYFLFDCSANSKAYAVTLLKAYSIFKKRLKSSLRLVVVLRNVTIEECVPDFKNYKYKKEVAVVAGAAEEAYALILASAYAFIYLVDDNEHKLPGLLAMQADTPVIAFDGPKTRSVYGKAALYCSPDEKQLAEQLMLLYKDEQEKMVRIEKGRAVASAYDWNKSADVLWQTILDLGRV